MFKKVILLVEDDINLNKFNRRALETEGYSVCSAGTLEQARGLLEKTAPDLILLDVKLPDGNGFDFCKELRGKSHYSAVPVLFLTSVNDNEGELEGLRSGGTDYLRKPYGIELLRIRVANLLKLKENLAYQELACGPFKLNMASNRAYLHGADMLLKPKEFLLLLMFIKNERRILNEKHIYKTVWELPMDNNGTLKKHISELRKKLESGKSGYSINTVYGKGYCFTAAPNFGLVF